MNTHDQAGALEDKPRSPAIRPCAKCKQLFSCGQRSQRDTCFTCLPHNVAPVIEAPFNEADFARIFATGRRT